ncbi:bifunctional Transcription factor CBF-NF-Y-archaeal histone domain/Histone-fold [Babesia duncani]|uniref:Bifunctional Transcription factor CBF-NF-Y-archaeal histone domain/Histone-fold n=1 Tax=Babesia duncani TaxID=323732 RepID=A0AAD9PGN3_9APIC|nr:bifunctional Transcription factor CBF-NF-Y-archaeal histone domain/Histone-fold [Babesia duncani]
MSKVSVPTYRVKRVLSLDPDTPKIAKAAIATLAKATGIFLEHFAANLHKRISDGSSYPVKEEHILALINDARYPKYHFLQDAKDLIAQQPESNAPELKLPESEGCNVPKPELTPDSTRIAPKMRKIEITNYFK